MLFAMMELISESFDCLFKLPKELIVFNLNGEIKIKQELMLADSLD